MECSAKPAVAGVNGGERRRASVRVRVFPCCRACKQRERESEEGGRVGTARRPGVYLHEVSAGRASRRWKVFAGGDDTHGASWPGTKELFSP